MDGSVNYRRNVFYVGLCVVIARSLFGSIRLCVQAYGSPCPFTHKQIDSKKRPRGLAMLIHRTILILSL